jgi:hypothetical protein
MWEMLKIGHIQQYFDDDFISLLPSIAATFLTPTLSFFRPLSSLRRYHTCDPRVCQSKGEKEQTQWIQICVGWHPYAARYGEILDLLKL